MNSYCVPLNCKVNPLTKDVSEYGLERHYNFPLTEISKEFNEFLLQHNLKLLLAELFYNPPKKITKIHIDALGGDYSKINFVYGGEKSLMCWYSSKEHVSTQVNYTSIDTKSINFLPNEVTLLHRQNVASPSIVQVGIPHNIINAAKERWCLSLVPVDITTNKRITFERTLEIFKNLVPQEGLEPSASSF
jgi:hypothetical protein